MTGPCANRHFHVHMPSHIFMCVGGAWYTYARAHTYGSYNKLGFLSPEDLNPNSYPSTFYESYILAPTHALRKLPLHTRPPPYCP